MIKRLLLMTMLMTGSAPSSDTNFINNQGKDLMSLWDSEAFDNLESLLMQVMEYDTKEIAAWGVNGINAIKAPITGSICGFTDGYMMLANISTYTGRFEVVNNRWVRVGDADDVQFYFTDKDGNDCVVKITTSGDTKVVNVPCEEDEAEEKSGKDGEEEESLFESEAIETCMADVNVVAVEVPEHAEFSVTQAGKQVMTLIVDLDLSYLGDTWDVKENGFAYNALFSVAKSMSAKTMGYDGNYDIAVSNCYKPGEGIKFSAEVKDNGNPVVSFNLNGIGTLNFDDGIMPIGEEEGTIKNLGIESLTADLDVMGNIQAKCSIPDFSAFTKKLTSSSEIEDETDAKKMANELNKQMNIDIYYEKENNTKGLVEFKPVYNEDLDEWSVESTINFTNDNSSQSLKDYFTEENLPDFMGTVLGIYRDIENMMSSVKKTKEEIDNEATKIMTITKEKGIYNDGENIQLLGQKPGSAAEIYSMGGVLCARIKVGFDGKAAIPYSLLPNDVYIIKTASGTQKFFRR